MHDKEIFLSLLPDIFGLKSEALVSYYMDMCPIQDSFRYRAKRMALQIANQVIDEKGELDRGQLDSFIKFFNKGPYILGPGREGDSMIYEHIKNSLEKLPDLWSWIKKFSYPVCHKRAEGIIRDTLLPEIVGKVQTFHVRRAVVAAQLTFLRQSTGSCFATAPAILIQKNSPSRFFKDLYDLLSMGQLKRVIGGKEYAVPLSFNDGKGELQKTTAMPLYYSPGLIAALEAAEIFLPTLSLEQKMTEVKLLLQKGPSVLNVELLIRSILLEAVGVTEDDLKSEEHLAQIQMTPLLIKQNTIFYQRPSPRAQKVAEWKKKFTNACRVFKAFTECSLLRAWEYTIASFSDVKVEFTRWNLYIGLGLQSQGDGVGAFLYSKINERLQKCNLEIERLHREYSERISAISALEVMYEEAINPNSRHQLKVELTTQVLSAQAILELREKMREKAESISDFFPSLLEQYDQKLQQYFQELFDPSILGDQSHLYDDSPAGFRLVYKHGRLDASQWSAIYTADQYIDSLREFFSVVENEILHPSSIDTEFISEITTALIQFIRDPQFLVSAKQRSNNVGRRSPWDYISGGTMQGLVQAYCSRDLPFTEAKIVPQSETELLDFLLHHKEGEVPLLIHSPTHAFVFCPNLLPADANLLVKQNQRFVEALKWDDNMKEYISHKLSERLPEIDRPLFLHRYRQKQVAQTKLLFRSNLIDSIGPQIKDREALVDSFLYEQIPLFTQMQAQEVIDKSLRLLGIGGGVSLNGEFFNPSEIHREIKTAFLKSSSNPFSHEDWDQKIANAMREVGAIYPHPILFADTNWSGWFFGFITNPATGVLELWRLNRISTQGFPMTDWKDYLNRQNSSPWILLSRPNEYSVLFE